MPSSTTTATRPTPARALSSHASVDHLRGMGSHSTPSSPSPWKSLFRLPNGSRRLASGGAVIGDESLSVDTSLSLSAMPPQPQSPALLTPTSLASVGPDRPSYNSSLTTVSSDDNGSMTPPDASVDLAARRHKSTVTAPPPLSPSTSAYFPGSQHPARQSTQPAPQQPQRPGMGARSISGSATRFLRRVASAPNAKGLFHLSSRTSSTPTTKNGHLAAPSHEAAHRAQTKADSIETISSGSSRGGRPPPPRFVSQPGTPALGVPKAPFRRTYSSNSIKVKQVRYYSTCAPRVNTQSRAVRARTIKIASRWNVMALLFARPSRLVCNLAVACLSCLQARRIVVSCGSGNNEYHRSCAVG